MNEAAAISETLLHAAIDRLYEAAITPDLLPSAFDRVADVCGGMGITLFPHDPHDMAMTYVSGSIADAATEYFTEWLDRCPRVAYSLRNPIYDRVFWDGDILSEQVLRDDPYFRDYGPSYDLCYSVVRATTGLHRTSRYVFSSPYSLKSGAPTAGQLRAFDILSGHAVRALQIYRKLGFESSASAGITGLLDHQSYGVMIVNAFGTVVHANAVADSYAGRGLSVQNGRLVAATHESQRALDLLLRDAIWPNASAPRIAPVALARGADRRPLLVQAMALRPTETQAVGGLLRSNAGAILLIVDPDTTSPPASEDTLRLLGLTPAEARIAAILGTGASPEAAAEALGLSVGTARNHIKRIFSKLDVARQSQLVALLARLTVQ